MGQDERIPEDLVVDDLVAVARVVVVDEGHGLHRSIPEQYAAIEQRVEEAEQIVQARRTELEYPANAMDAPRLVSAQTALDAAQQALDALYARWAELEKKSG